MLVEILPVVDGCLIGAVSLLSSSVPVEIETERTARHAA
jgi:hypothetical protein